MRQFYQYFLDSEKQKEKVKAQTREQLYQENQKIVLEALKIDEKRDKEKEDFKKMIASKQALNALRNARSQSVVLEKIEQENIKYLNQVKEGEKKIIEKEQKLALRREKMLLKFKHDLLEQIEKQEKEKEIAIIKEKQKFTEQVNIQVDKYKKEDQEFMKNEKLKYMTYADDLKNQLKNKRLIARKRNTLNNCELSMNSELLKGYNYNID